MKRELLPISEDIIEVYSFLSVLKDGNDGTSYARRLLNIEISEIEIFRDFKKATKMKISQTAMSLIDS